MDLWVDEMTAAFFCFHTAEVEWTTWIFFMSKVTCETWMFEAKWVILLWIITFYDLKPGSRYP